MQSVQELPQGVSKQAKLLYELGELRTYTAGFKGCLKGWKLAPHTGHYQRWVREVTSWEKQSGIGSWRGTDLRSFENEVAALNWLTKTDVPS